MYVTHIERPNAAVIAFGPDDARERGIQNWSLAPLQEQADAFRHPNRTFVSELAFQFSGMHTGVPLARVFAPAVAHASGRIIEREQLSSRIRLGAAELYRNPGVPADGVFIEPGDAFVMSAAGCPFIIAHDRNGKFFAVAHAGRDSLVDRGAVMGTPSKGRSVSVVHALIGAFAKRGVPARKIEMQMHFALPCSSFEHRSDHPQYGEYNRRLGAFVDSRWRGCTKYRDDALFLHLEFLFSEQAIGFGIKSVTAMNGLEEHPTLAHTHDGHESSRRNLYIVKRNA